MERSDGNLGEAALWVFGGLLMTLACCADPAPVASKAVCPPVIVYTDAELHRAASEVSRLPPGSELALMLEDYRSERAMLRACKAS